MWGSEEEKRQLKIKKKKKGSFCISGKNSIAKPVLEIEPRHALRLSVCLDADKKLKLFHYLAYFYYYS